MLSQTWVVSWPPYSMCALRQTSGWGVVSSETAAILLNKLDSVVTIVATEITVFTLLEEHALYLQVMG